MPCKDAAISTSWISTNFDLDQAVARWGDVIGLDTEFIRTDTFYPVAGLYQIASGDEVYLLDPLAIDDWSRFVAYLENPDTVIIMHACQEDLELLHHHLGARPLGLFDSQFANAYLSSDFSLSYARLVEQRLGFELSKHETRSNWLKRPLSDEQLRYAVEDVIHLTPLYEKLSSELVELERTYWIAADIGSRTTYADIDPNDYYRNVKRAWQLDAQELPVLRELAAWRERTARTLDIPRNRVVWDEHLLAFARVANLTEQIVHDTLPRGIARRFADYLLEYHAIGSSAEQLELEPIERPLTSAQGALLKSLRDVARKKAEELGLAPELMSRKRDLETCIRRYLECGDLSDFYSGWRAPHLADNFRQMLSQLSQTGP